ncbi:MAG: BrnT family toxin [Patescibacteria group bacterium]
MAFPRLVKIVGFDWDEGNTSHIAKHNVLPKEAEDVFFDKNNVLEDDPKHSEIEQRYLVVGKTKGERLLYQVFTIRDNKIRVISSRDINKKEASLYEKKTDTSKI